MNKDQKADLIVGAATAVVLLGLGVLTAKSLFEDLKAAGVLDKARDDAAKLAKQIWSANAPGASQVAAQDLVDGLKTTWAPKGPGA